ncbi:hypothetical protein [Niallia sp. Krafla_26]|uniref:hypothetical protein n=1 Tax=Niallia sp. Krafla_26 TaxID=3064703 RepID=UPI003D16B23F
MSTMMNELGELEKILKKDPIINTATWEELTASPESIERNYRKHTMTHMSLGDAQDYESRMVNRLVKQQKVFSGLVTGDFGLGKTSMLVNLWHKAEEQGMMAVPPFSWRSLDELFTGIQAWVSYRLDKKSISEREEFEEIASQFQKRGMKSEIKLLVSSGMTAENAQAFLENKIKEGNYRLERTIAEFLQFCDRITNFLVDECGYSGLMVFTDELQITLNELAPEKVFQYLFELSNSTLNREGRYGIMMGLPLNSFVQMQQVKSDALDRFQSQKMLIDLSKIYTSDFAVQLWDRYATYFGFEAYKNEIIDSFAVKALGQLTDSSRKDIGNGPRSVISAFNAIVKHYQETKQTYTVLNLVEDCMKEEILLGERSNFISIVQSLIEKVGKDEAYVKLIYALAAFPQGCKPEVLSHYELLNPKSETLLKEWIGVEIRQSLIEGYKLVAMDQIQTAPQSFIEQAIKDFLRYYQANEMSAMENAVHSFNGVIVPDLLTERGDLDWRCLFDQSTEDPIEFKSFSRGVYATDLGGTYFKVKDRYPNRHLQLVTTSTLADKKVPKIQDYDPNYVYTGKWVFLLDLEGKRDNKVVRQSSDPYFFVFNLNVKTKIEVEIPLLSDLIPFEQTDVQLLLNLLHYLTKTSNIPTSEQDELNFVKGEMINEVIAALFDVNMKQIHGSDWQLRNHGRNILIELFEKMCEARFPEYKTIMVGRWKSKMAYFKAVFESEKISLSQKRGIEPLAKQYPRMTAKQKKDIAAMFTLGSVAPFETLMTDFPSLISIHDDDHLYVNTHPAEHLVVEMIEESTEEITVLRKKARAVDFTKVSEALVELGYTKPERDQLFEFAELRKLFFKNGNRDKLYMKPLTIEEWRANLDGQVQYIDSLKTELELQGQNETVHLEPIQAQIEKLQDEETYERLSSVLRDVLYSLQKKMSLFVNRSIDIIEEKLKKSGQVLSKLDGTLSGIQSVEYAEKEKWFQYKTNLDTLFKDLQDQYADITTEKAALHKTSMHDFSETNDGVNFFVDMTSKIERINRQWDDLKPKRKELEAAVDEWSKWEGYYQERKGLGDLLDRLQSMGLTHLIEKIENLDAEIDQEWEGDGLPSYAQWMKRLREVREEITQELQKSRKQFEEEKQKYQQILKNLSIRGQLHTQFKEDEQSSSYQDLQTEFESSIMKQIDQWLDATDYLEQRLRYYTDVLELDVEEIENEVFDITNRLLQAKTNFESGIQTDEVKKIKMLPTRITKAKSLVSNAVKKGELTEQEAEVLSAIEGKSCTLEDLILKIADQTDKFELEEVLRVATNLFKKNHINIKIEKGGE